MRGRVWLVTLALLLVWPRPAGAADEIAEANIRSALTAWTTDFNGRRTDKVCDLFEPDLKADFRELPEQHYDDICGRLKRALADTARVWTYAPPDIKEILVFGDIAVARLVWTATVKGAPEGEVKSVEPGMDIFRRQPDGGWKIMRYLAFAE
jgi:ketosteroid isomerase-like protein